MNYLSEEKREIFSTLNETDGKLFLLHVYGNPLETFLNTWSRNFGENEAFLSSYLLKTIKTFIHCLNVAQKYKISSIEREKAIQICGHNLYFIWKLFGLPFEETADDSALLFGDITSRIFCLNTEYKSSVLLEEYESITVEDSPAVIEMRHVFLYLGSLLYKCANHEDDTFYTFDLKNRSSVLPILFY